MKDSFANGSVFQKSVEVTRFRLNDGTIRVKCLETLSQMMSYQKIGGKIGCPKPKHDDLVMALMVGIQMAKVVSAKQKKKEVTKAPKFSLEWWASRDETRGQTKRLGW